MPRGRKRTPTSLLVLHGSRLAKERSGEVAPPHAALTPPGWLSPRAREHWQATAPGLSQVGLLTVLDVTAWAAACCVWGRALDLQAMLDLDGMVLQGEDGSLRLHPALRMQHKCFEMYHKLASDFGASPRSRVGLPAPPPGPDALEVFINRGKALPGPRRRPGAQPTEEGD